MHSFSLWSAAVASLLAAKCAATWTLSFEDDFNGPAINTSTWVVADKMTHGDQEWQLYEASNVYQAGGNLVVRTKIAPTHAPNNRLYNFTSGWVDSKSKWAQTYGRFVARIKLPNPLSGVWPGKGDITFNATRL